MDRPRISLFSLGGTIIMKGEADRPAIPALDTEAILASVPEVGEIASIESISARQVPGAQLVEQDLIELGRAIEARFRQGTDAVVITQGTDTLEESAYLLDLTVDGQRPVVLTGALRNHGMLGADGPANLLAAVRTAASPLTRSLGALVVMNDQIHSARFVRKVHTSNPSAFASPLVGAIGWVTEGTVRIVTRPARAPYIQVPRDSPDRAVALLKLSLGDDGRLVKAVRDLGFDGLVVEGFGGGHVPESVADSLEDAASAMPVVLSSRTGSGEILQRTYGFPGSETDLIRRGLIPAGYLDGLKARILLSLLLRSGVSRNGIAQAFREQSTASFV